MEPSTHDWGSAVEALSERGWTLEYVLGLTHRQFSVLWERYWDRKKWEIEIQLKTNPFYSPKGTTSSSELDGERETKIDLTTDDGVKQLISETSNFSYPGGGSPIKVIKT